MNDLISRQAAIDALCDEYCGGWKDCKYYPKCENLKSILNLPSAMPERLTDDDFETIRIHLNAYKEKLCNQRRWKEADEYQQIVDKLNTIMDAERREE